MSVFTMQAQEYWTTKGRRTFRPRARGNPARNAAGRGTTGDARSGRGARGKWGINASEKTDHGYLTLRI